MCLVFIYNFYYISLIINYSYINIPKKRIYKLYKLLYGSVNFDLNKIIRF